jgi:hypothetical protein
MTYEKNAAIIAQGPHCQSVAKAAAMSRLSFTKLLALVLLSGGLASAFGVDRTHAQENSGAAEFVPEPSAEVKRIALEMRRHVAAIRSIHYTFRQTGRTPARIPGPIPVGERPLIDAVRTGEFAYDEGKYLSIFDVLRDDQRPFSRRVAFDGSLYQSFDPVGKELIITATFSKNMSSGLPPVWMPFVFVKRASDRLDLEALDSEEVWLDFSRNATLLAPRRVGEHDCEVLQCTQSLSNGLEAQTWEICAAKDLGYFPIHQTTRRTGFNSVREYTEFEKFQTPKGTLMIPTRSIGKSWAHGEKLIQEEQIEITLLSVNKPLAAPMFTLTADATKVVLDSDVPAETQMRYEPHESRLSWTVESILWALGLIAILALLALAWRKSRKREEAVLEKTAAPASGARQPSRGWLQFSLRGLMVIVLLFATLAGFARSLRKQVVFGGLPDSSQAPLDITAIQYERDQFGRNLPRVMRRYRPKMLLYSETWFKPGQGAQPDFEKRVLYYSNRQKAIEEQPLGKYQCWLPNGATASWKEANAILTRDNGDGTFGLGNLVPKGASE